MNGNKQCLEFIICQNLKLQFKNLTYICCTYEANTVKTKQVIYLIDLILFYVLFHTTCMKTPLVGVKN